MCMLPMLASSMRAHIQHTLPPAVKCSPPTHGISAQRSPSEMNCPRCLLRTSHIGILSLPAAKIPQSRRKHMFTVNHLVNTGSATYPYQLGNASYSHRGFGSQVPPKGQLHRKVL